jgi:glycosyltransferase involved in cell wall biosynthesis
MDRSYRIDRHARATGELAALITRERPEILHVHTPVASIVGRVAAALRRTPHVVYTAHGFYFHDDMPAFERFAHIALEGILARATDVLLTQSEEDHQAAIRYRIRPRRFLRTLGNGVDIDAIAAFAPERNAVRSELGIAPRDVVVGFIGRHVREKGFFDLVEAMRLVAKDHPRTILLTIGANMKGDRDPVTEFPETAVRVLHLGHRADARRLVHAFDIFALPSYREGMPRSILEAMAAAKPVVASAIRGCREEVVHGATGYLIPVRAPTALATAISALVQSQDLREAMGHAGFVRARAKFDERLVIERLLDVYRTLLGAS